MAAWIRAGIAYFAAVFAVGFLFGAIRVTLVIPRIGELAAVFVELPLILTASWLLCRWIVRKYGVAAADRLAMGGLALLLLLAAECLLSVALAGRTLMEHFAMYVELPAQIGLAGQCVFALFPWAMSRARA